MNTNDLAHGWETTSALPGGRPSPLIEMESRYGLNGSRVAAIYFRDKFQTGPRLAGHKCIPTLGPFMNFTYWYMYTDAYLYLKV